MIIMAKRRASFDGNEGASSSRKSARLSSNTHAASMASERPTNTAEANTLDERHSLQQEAQNSETSIPKLTVTERTGDLFSAPSGTLLVHACNCEGSWGKGIAEQFRTRYPSAFRTYQSHCRSRDRRQLAGSSLMIEPGEGKTKQHFIGCLFTSIGKGRNKDKPSTILDSTKTAMDQLIHQITEHNCNTEPKIKQIWMCQIHSGLFNVPWKDTQAVLERIECPGVAEMMPIVVISRD